MTSREQKLEELLRIIADSRALDVGEILRLAHAALADAAAPIAKEEK